MDAMDINKVKISMEHSNDVVKSLSNYFYHYRTVINLHWSWTMHGNEVSNQVLQLTLILP